MTARPLISLLSTVDSDLGVADTLTSLQLQGDRAWEWCLAVGSAAPAGTHRALRTLVAAEPRVLVIGSEDLVTTALPEALTDRARGEHLAWLGQGAVLAASTVGDVRRALGTADWVYTGEAVRSPTGEPTARWHKPDWSPELLRSQPYALHLAVLPVTAVTAVGGFARRSPAPWYDLVLKVSEVTGPPAHLPGPHYLRPDWSVETAGTVLPEPPFLDDPAEARCRVVSDHCARTALAVDEVAPVQVRGRAVGQRLLRRPSRTPRVSIVIPTAGGSSATHGFPRCHVSELVDVLSRPGGYPDLEVVVVHDERTPPGVLEQIDQVTGGRWVSVPFYGPFHFSRKCNAGAMVATGEYLCFLNDDMDVATPDWLSEMASLLEDPTVGAVGARLLFSDGTLQHAGHVYHHANPGHLLFGAANDTLASGGWAQVTGERSGVTGACLLVRATDFHEVGGFSEQFPLNYNDVDLCLKLRATGLRILYTPHAVLYHYESQTRVAQVTDQEMTRVRRRWLRELEVDPYWSADRPPVAGTGALVHPRPTAPRRGKQ